MGTEKKGQKKLGVTTLEDISILILQSHDLDETLKNIVALVAARTGTDVCSIYLLDEDKITLRLRSTQGLLPSAVGRVTMTIHEGLTGLAIQERRVIAIKEPEKHPRYRYFEETREEQFHSFLGVPLFDRKEPIGVLVIQTREKRQFTPEEISALSTIAFQVALIIANAELLDSLARRIEGEGQQDKGTLRGDGTATAESAVENESSETFLRGKVAYPGVSSGPAHLMDGEFGIPSEPHGTAVDRVAELAHLEAGLEKTRIETIYLEKRVAEHLTPDDAAIFHTHLMILEGHSFLEKTKHLISQGRNAFHAVHKVLGDYIEAFEKMDDPYLRERGADIKDIRRRLLGNLAGHGYSALTITTDGILVAQELLPSDMAALDHRRIKGIAVERSGENAHAIIMAKSLGIPTLVGVTGVARAVTTGDHLILDANSGFLYINPKPQIVEEYRRLENDRQEEFDRHQKLAHLPAISKDGTQVTLRANIGLISDVEVALRNGAKGVGLYRTEFPYMIRDTFPDRQDQYLLYRKVVESFQGEPVTIRTLDIGGDKGLPYFTPPEEENPFMGWRSVRFSLDNRDIFRTQIEAILMAAYHGPVKLLFPMISSMEEVLACKSVVRDALGNLDAGGLAHARHVPVGVMIEVPAAVQLVQHLVKEVDFFALGTNDLIQYMLASDRNNPLVRKYYDPLHPSILHVIRQVSAFAVGEGKGLCLCGEMVTEPMNFLVLIGMGIREFSMAAPSIPRVKEILGNVTTDQATRAADHVLQMSHSSGIRSYLNEILAEIQLP